VLTIDSVGLSHEVKDEIDLEWHSHRERLQIATCLM